MSYPEFFARPVRPIPVDAVPSSEPPCLCPPDAYHPQCKRHEHMVDSGRYYDGTMGKDHLADYEKYKANPWRQEQPMKHAKWVHDLHEAARVYAAQTITPPHEMFQGPTLHAGDRMSVQMPDGSLYADVIQAQDDIYQDATLAFMKFQGPRPQPPPGGWPKPKLRSRIRIKRHRLNHAVQQWIHDHLPESYCDN